MGERRIKERWMVKNKSADFASICARFGVSEVAARLMVNRGLTGEEEIDTYLHPALSALHPAALLKDAERTANILAAKLMDGKKIRIIGDYDVDGVTAVYIFLTALRECGGDDAESRVDYAIPDRVRDGYGINDRLVEEAIADGVDTILTCDNGIAAPEQVAAAKAHGLTVLITDHHELQEILPEADAIVNPKQPDCAYPYPGLCGAAVAYKVAGLLYGRVTGEERRVEKLLPFAAIATVCDVMELTGENRTIVSLGLAMLRRSEHLGIRALMAANGISPEQVSAYHLGFVLGPCLNATGRLSEAVRGVQLLLAGEEEAAQLAQELKELNDLRKQMTIQGTEEAIRQVESGMLQDRVLVVYLPECHESLAGIVAGKLRERYNRPTLVVTRSEDGLKGSGRSIEGYSMFEKLTECRGLLTRYGGHPMAAGFSLPEENLPILREQLNERCGLTEDDL
ncbi:MAG: single-stranded-DNA-specific exonuclease RecJ, partial [Lachnospiraceae bacterium]|nr:single-stranded-DNA-specific exonuclease RecJ [Lachnospiraceae bacterium]